MPDDRECPYCNVPMSLHEPGLCDQYIEDYITAQEIKAEMKREEEEGIE